MPCVYFLKCNNGRIYIGSTNNLERRLLEHDSGLTKSTMNLRPLELVFHKKYSSLLKARKIELKLKRFKNKAIIEQIITDKDIKTDS